MTGIRTGLTALAIGAALFIGSTLGAGSEKYGHWQQTYFKDQPEESVQFINSMPDDCNISVAPMAVGGVLYIFVYYACPNGDAPENPLS